MEAKAIAKMVRISPLKARLVIDLIRGKKAVDAQIILENYNTKASRLVKKTLDSAIANATNNFSMKLENLVVSFLQYTLQCAKKLQNTVVIFYFIYLRYIHPTPSHCRKSPGQCRNSA